MKLSRHLQSLINSFSGKRISTSSLQFRLTLELVALSVLGLGSVAVWAGWQMEQNLVAAHKQTLEYIAMRFPEQLQLYSQVGSVETGLEQTINRVPTPGLVVWVKNSDGQVLAQSPNSDRSFAEIGAVESSYPRSLSEQSIDCEYNKVFFLQEYFPLSASENLVLTQFLRQ